MITEEKVWESLSNCFDPEIPVNIVDLGLVYDVQINNSNINVKMTLTTKGCPMHSQISQDVKSKLMAVEGVTETNVEIVWDPPWNPQMISESARKKLGFE
jgi:metal-sulfur cluster biosynthetic enzyme